MNITIETDWKKMEPLVTVVAITKTGGLRIGYLTEDRIFHSNDGLNWNPADVLGWADITPIENTLNNIFNEYRETH